MQGLYYQHITKDNAGDQVGCFILDHTVKLETDFDYLLLPIYNNVLLTLHP